MGLQTEVILLFQPQPQQTSLKLKVSERKWKEKLKEWGFQKHLSSVSMDYIVAKAVKRVREEGKDTIFYHHDSEVPHLLIEEFKKRRMVKAVSPNAGKLECFWSN